MSRNLVKLALVGIAAGLCFSGQSPSKNPEPEKELAMSCTKKESAEQDDMNGQPMDQMKKGNGGGKCGGPNGCGYSSGKGDQSKNSQMKKKRSAAQKVVQGG